MTARAASCLPSGHIGGYGQPGKLLAPPNVVDEVGWPALAETRDALAYDRDRQLLASSSVARERPVRAELHPLGVMSRRGPPSTLPGNVGSSRNGR